MNYKYYHYNSLASTQDKAKEFAQKGLSNIAVISDVQTKGRGRFKRKWTSSKGGLWVSILLKPENVENLQYLTFAAAVAVVKSIKKITGIDTKIKWPNDVHFKGKKLCGILTEGILGRENYVAVGIGLNVNQKKFPDSIKNSATSLNLIKHKTFDIKKLIDLILNEFFILYGGDYIKNKSRNILKLWKKYSDTIGSDVKVISKNGILEGNAIDIDSNGSLILKTKNNQVCKIIEGDILVRY